MSGSRIAAAILLITLALPAAAIVNGTAVSDQRFYARYPWMVTVVDQADGGICGGVLAAPRWVVTAAHCSWGRRYVLAGAAERSQARKVAVRRAVRHPGFSIDSLQNDVALLELEQPLALPPAPLASAVEARSLLRKGVTGLIVGWGRTENSPPVDRLREAVVRLQDLAQVGSRYAYNYTSGPCARDSGSPMLLQTIDGRWLVVGIANATSGDLCLSGGGVAVYTSLASTVDFLVETMGADGGL